MRLTEKELKHVLNVEWGLRFSHWFRWILLAILTAATASRFTDALPIRPLDNQWLVVGFVYLLVAWPGLCRAYVYMTLRRILDADPEAREQLVKAGSKTVNLPDSFGRSGP